MKSIDLTDQKLLAVRDVQSARSEGATELLVGSGCVITPAAQDFIGQHGITLRTVEGKKKACPAAKAASPAQRAAGRGADTPATRLFNSPEAQAIKEEICSVGRKLWARMYVDGNGGNISYRIGPNEVICTPTLVSKGDLRPEDLCMVDLEGNQIAGGPPRTSEILLHLEIFKAVPEAKAAVHCHPPHATAYAITGQTPPSRLVPEYEVFVGKVAVSPYETPGTLAFAQTVLPFVKQHNTVLLANHGVVCWADTVTHAEWYAEVLDTYCWTLMLANQIGAPFSYIPPEKASDLLDIKKRLGLPDIRFEKGHLKECQLSDMPDAPGSISVPANTCVLAQNPPSQDDVDALVKSVTDAVMAVLKEE
jgi:L-fuculose-phosphate aldolase